MSEVRFTPDWHRMHRRASVFVLALGLISCAEHLQLTEQQGQILFDSGDPAAGDIDIYVMDPDGSQVRQVTETGPGTRSLAEVYPEFELYVMDADGGNVERLTSNNHFDGHPDW